MMTMSTMQSVITIAVVVFATMVTRFTVFLLFPDSKTPPRLIRYLGDVLPYAMTGMLVVYSLKNVSFVSGDHGIPMLIAIAVLVLIYRWRHNSLLAIFVGTVLYMVLVQTVFA